MSSSIESGRERLAWLVATTLGFGDRLPAPGTTAGSLPAAAGWWLVCLLLPSTAAQIVASVVGALLATVVGVWAAEVDARRRGASDPGPIVIDEVAGQWLCFAVALPLMPLLAGAELALATAAGFFLFRVFDVVKPWPVRRLERLPGGIGIVADDLAAGALAGLVLGIGWRLLM